MGGVLWAMCWRLGCRARSVQEDRRGHTRRCARHMNRGRKRRIGTTGTHCGRRSPEGWSQPPAVGAVGHAWLRARQLWCPRRDGVLGTICAGAASRAHARHCATGLAAPDARQSCEDTRAWPSDTPDPGLPRAGAPGLRCRPLADCPDRLHACRAAQSANRHGRQAPCSQMGPMGARVYYCLLLRIHVPGTSIKPAPAPPHPQARSPFESPPHHTVSPLPPLSAIAMRCTSLVLALLSLAALVVASVRAPNA